MSFERPMKKSLHGLIKLYNDTGDIEPLRLKLTPRQRAFCEEYVVDYNGTKAALRAGYAAQYADRQAGVLRTNQAINTYIDYLGRSKEAKITAVNPDYVINKVLEIVTKEGAKDNDKLRGLELLARHLGMFIDRQEITGKDGGAIEVENRRVEEEAQSFTSMMDSLREKAQKDKTLQ